MLKSRMRVEVLCEECGTMTLRDIGDCPACISTMEIQKMLLDTHELLFPTPCGYCRNAYPDGCDVGDCKNHDKFMGLKLYRIERSA